MGVHLRAKSLSYDKVSQIIRLKAHEELGLTFPLAQKGGDDRGNFSFQLSESMTSLKQLEPRYTSVWSL